MKAVLRAIKRLWPRTKLRWFITIGALLLVGSAVSVEVTSQSDFCDNCHIMESYYASWTTDVHREIACVKCHIAPGTENFIKAKLNGFGQVVDDVLNREGTKPSASVSDFSCTRSGCHVRDILGKAEATNGKSYKFDHAKHLDLTYVGIGVHCTTCHSHVMEGKHFEVNTNVCVACHLIGSAGAENTRSQASLAVLHDGMNLYADSEETVSNATQPVGWKTAPSNCAACHDAPSQPIVRNGLTIDHAEYLRFGASCDSCHRGVTAPVHRVESSQCYNCHDFGMDRLAEIGSVSDLHRLHSEGEHKVECFSCHGVIAHGPMAQTMSLDSFDCRECHSAQHMVQRTTYQSDHGPVAGRGEGSEQAAVSPMFLAHVDCTGCHVQAGPLRIKPSSGATVAKAVPEACDKCHRPGFGKELVPLWQRDTHALFDDVVKLIPTEDMLTKPNAEAATLFKEARELLELVRTDGSWGVHNPRYTQRLIEQAREKAMKARQMSAPSPAEEEPTS